ncbi:MAG TPA: Crp/Fnr family transcriptional regulator [Solirubrobacteraceae bacterium]|nr:Crp/Fnr family transcriptional regulator [Solirubrobacteraceae bacterium]
MIGGRGVRKPRSEATLSTLERSDDEDYELLAHRRTPLTVPAGDVIFRQGDQADGMYLVREGSVALKEDDRVVETIAAPGLFGEMALIEDEPRSLLAVAQTDDSLIEIPTQRFWVLVHETPCFARLVMRVMSERLRRRGLPT